jgi:lysophospholipase L1-like esterase
VRLPRYLAALVFAYLIAITVAAAPVAFQPLRRQYLGELALTWANRHPPRFALVGDSLTDNGTPWSPSLSGSLVGAVTVARSGSTTWQVADLLPRALSLKPKTIVLTAGTNDITAPGYSAAATAARIVGMVDTAKASGADVIVTLPPPVSSRSRSIQTRDLDLKIAGVLKGKSVAIIDLWPLLSRGGVIEPRYTVDGIHFTDAAYKIWAAEILRAEKNRSERFAP